MEYFYILTLMISRGGAVYNQVHSGVTTVESSEKRHEVYNRIYSAACQRFDVDVPNTAVVFWSLERNDL